MLIPPSCFSVVHLSLQSYWRTSLSSLRTSLSSLSEGVIMALLTFTCHQLGSSIWYQCDVSKLPSRAGPMCSALQYCNLDYTCTMGNENFTTLPLGCRNAVMRTASSTYSKLKWASDSPASWQAMCMYQNLRESQKKSIKIEREENHVIRCLMFVCGGRVLKSASLLSPPLPNLLSSPVLYILSRLDSRKWLAYLYVKNVAVNLSDKYSRAVKSKNKCLKLSTY